MEEALAARAYRIGISPREYDGLQPFEVWDLEEAWRWRRDRDWELRATGIALSVMAASGKEQDFKTLHTEICEMLVGYKPDRPGA